jgi:hypothetical protein
VGLERGVAGIVAGMSCMGAMAIVFLLGVFLFFLIRQ